MCLPNLGSLRGSAWPPPCTELRTLSPGLAAWGSRRARLVYFLSEEPQSFPAQCPLCRKPFFRCFAHVEVVSAGRVNLSGSRIQLGFSEPKGKIFTLLRFSTTPFPLGWWNLERPGLQSKGPRAEVTREVRNKHKQMPLNNITSHSTQMVTHAISFI